MGVAVRSWGSKNSLVLSSGQATTLLRVGSWVGLKKNATSAMRSMALGGRPLRQQTPSQAAIGRRIPGRSC